jgi:hypothetical protein
MDIKKALHRLKAAALGRIAADEGVDGFPLDPASPHFAWQCCINEFLVEVPDFTQEYAIKPATYPSGRRILEAIPSDRIAIIEALMLRRVWLHKAHSHSFSTSFGLLHKLTNLLFRRELPYTATQAANLVSIIGSQVAATHWFDDHLAPILKICDRLKAQGGVAPELKTALQDLKTRLRPGSQWESAARKRVRDGIDRLLAARQPELLDAGEVWSNAAREDIKQMADRNRDGWLALLEHCHTADSSKPAQKWSRAARELVEALGRDAFKEHVVRWFELVALPRPIHCEARSRWQPDPDLLITDRNSRILKGLAWSCAGLADEEVSRALSNLAEVCFKKVRNLGPRCPRVGNACLYALSSTSSKDAAAQLSRLDQRVKQPTAKKRISKSLDSAAELTGQTREDLEECSVSRYGFDEHSCLRQTFGEFTAEFRIADTNETDLKWRKADGKIQKSVPTTVKEQYATEFRQFKRTMRDIEKMLPAQRTRVERLLLSEREWSLEEWHERYLNHPLLTCITRRLIWHFKLGDRAATAIWHEGKLVDAQDRPLDWLAPETRVRLWHPIGFEASTVGAWRCWLETHRISQPFKQAHREIYILTEAELQTATYSNRFAAHIIKQHQFAALTQQRGWQYRLMGNFDFQSTPTLLLPRWGLAAEFWVESTGDRDDSSETGISLYLSTDQVRFRGPDGAPRPLSEVPALVFSEVMRDLDLFVGVCSIGADPAWQDTGLANGDEYWRHYSFGDLSGTAQTRRDVLGRLLPKLKIASRCELHDRFLHVRGDLRTYKIHLGSGNILMEPNDQYLCIVPDRRPTNREKVFLPFEGDSTLSVIVSKAFMLADDARIKEPGILSQIRRS